jgi:hypothetical protein
MVHNMTKAQQQQLNKALHLATLLSSEEWRMVHNGLSMYQSTFGSIHDSEYAAAQRAKLQQLMDKIRDNFIKPNDKVPSPNA